MNYDFCISSSSIDVSTEVVLAYDSGCFAYIWRHQAKFSSSIDQNRLGHSTKQINPDLLAANCKKVYLPITCRPMQFGQFAGVPLLQVVLRAQDAPMVKLHQLLFHREMKAKDLARNFRPGLEVLHIVSPTFHWPNWIIGWETSSSSVLRKRNGIGEHPAKIHPLGDFMSCFILQKSIFWSYQLGVDSTSTSNLPDGYIGGPIECRGQEHTPEHRLRGSCPAKLCFNNWPALLLHEFQIT